MNKNKRRKKLIINFLVLLISFFYSSFFYEVNAEETNITEEILKSQSDSIGISSFIEEANKYKSEDFDINVSEIISSAIKGNVDNKSLGSKILSILFKEARETISVIGSIMIIIIISSILKNIGDNLENNGISQIVHYVTYILIVSLIMKNFSDIITMVKSSIEDLVGFSNSLIPLLITLMITTGNIASASMLQPIILLIITFIGNFINIVLIPATLISIALGIISNISDKIQIDKLSKYINTSVVWALGIVLTIFVGVSSLEGSITNGIDALTVKTTKAAVSNFIPVVGKILRRCSRYGNEL